ncbi:MAG: hypothetical protein NTX59_00765 [Elusimicrobia bacterium]|nr:hypothetical protein [Elusimicrobiota bacterium]
MKKSLLIIALAVFSGTAYAGPALEQLNMGDMRLELPAPTAVKMVQEDPSGDIGIAHSLMYEDLASCGGFTARHPQNDHLLFITAGHCIRPDKSFFIGFGKSTFVNGALGGMVREVSNNRIIAYYPPPQGDVAVFDLNGLKIEGRNDSYIKILKVREQANNHGALLLNYGSAGGFSDLAIRQCTYNTIKKDYGNGIQLAETTCSIPDELRNLLNDNDSRDAHGTSGSPVVEEYDKTTLVGIVRGSLGGELSDTGIAVFDLRRILEQQKLYSAKKIRTNILAEAARHASSTERY